MKIFLRILIILLCIVLLGYAGYKIAYPYVAPVLFDYLVDTNLDAFMKLEQSLSESVGTESATTSPKNSSESVTGESTPPMQEPQQSQAGAADQPNQTPKPKMEIQAVKTTMGVFSGEHLARALKNISPKDKTRIISLCQSAVSTSDILKVSKMMMQDGLTKEQQKYIENYLRDNLSVPEKREILEILKQY